MTKRLAFGQTVVQPCKKAFAFKRREIGQWCCMLTYSMESPGAKMCRADCSLRRARSPIKRNNSLTSAKTIENSPPAGGKTAFSLKNTEGYDG
jgi:hypothetical protein